MSDPRPPADPYRVQAPPPGPEVWAPPVVVEWAAYLRHLLRPQPKTRGGEEK